MTPRRIAPLALLLALTGVGVWGGSSAWTWATTKTVYVKERSPVQKVGSWPGPHLYVCAYRFRRWDPVNVTSRVPQALECMGEWRIRDGTNRSANPSSQPPSAPWIRSGQTFAEWWGSLASDSKREVR